jgi:hypothetical protein
MVSIQEGTTARNVPVGTFWAWVVWVAGGAVLIGTVVAAVVTAGVVIAGAVVDGVVMDGVDVVSLAQLHKNELNAITKINKTKKSFFNFFLLFSYLCFSVRLLLIITSLLLNLQNNPSFA